MARKHWISTSSTSFTTASNWSDGVAPANSDTLVFNSLGTANVETDLSTTLTGLTLVVEQSYTGQIGVLAGNTATYLTISGGTLKVGQSTGQGSAAGSPLVMVDFGGGDTSAAGTVYIFDSSSTSASTFYPPVLVRHSSADAGVPVTTINQTGGNIGLAALTGDTSGSNKFVLQAAKPDDRAPNVPAQAYFGQGSTLSTSSADTGTIHYRSANATSATITLSGDAVLVLDGSANLGTIQVWDDAQVLDYGTQSTIAALNLAGTYRRMNPATVAVTAATFYRGSTLDTAVGRAAVSFGTKSLASDAAMQDVTWRTATAELF